MRRRRENQDCAAVYFLLYFWEREFWPISSRKWVVESR